MKQIKSLLIKIASVTIILYLLLLINQADRVRVSTFGIFSCKLWLIWLGLGVGLTMTSTTTVEENIHFFLSASHLDGATSSYFHWRCREEGQTSVHTNGRLTNSDSFYAPGRHVKGACYLPNMKAATTPFMLCGNATC